MTSPVFVYYQSSFLPTIPSLSLALVAMFHYAKYSNFENKLLYSTGENTEESINDNSVKHFVYCIILLTFSTLSRTTFAIPLIAIICVETLRYFRFKSLSKDKKSFHIKLLITAIAMFSILGFAYHNNILRAKYGSIFLSSFMPAQSWEEVQSLISLSYDNWIAQYFSRSHYHIITIILVLSIFTKLFLKKVASGSIKQFLFLVVIITFGCVIFTALMLQQFFSHDYYFLDSFFLPAGLGLIFVLSFFPTVSDFIKVKYHWRIIIHAVILISIATPLLNKANRNQKTRRRVSENDKMHNMIVNFKDADKLLSELKIPAEATISIITALAPNTPFVFLNRKGYAVMSLSKRDISKSLDWPYDYIIIQNEFFLAEVHPIYPELINHLTKVGDNGKISVCTYHEKE
jgi:hypothetical protein